MRKHGFTLSEIVVAISLIGVLSASTVPKVLLAYDVHQKKAVFKETLSILGEVNYSGKLNKELYPSNSWYYFKDHINANKYCTDANDEGCWTKAVQDVTFYSGQISEQHQPGFVLSNGATVMGIDGGIEGAYARNDLGGGSWGDCAVVDWNGTKEPNQEGIDQLFVCFGFGNKPYLGVKPGALGPNFDFPTAVNLYCEIYDCNTYTLYQETISNGKTYPQQVLDAIDQMGQQPSQNNQPGQSNVPVSASNPGPEVTTVIPATPSTSPSSTPSTSSSTPSSSGSTGTDGSSKTTQDTVTKVVTNVVKTVQTTVKTVASNTSTSKPKSSSGSKTTSSKPKTTSSKPKTTTTSKTTTSTKTTKTSSSKTTTNTSSTSGTSGTSGSTGSTTTTTGSTTSGTSGTSGSTTTTSSNTGSTSGSTQTSSTSGSTTTTTTNTGSSGSDLTSVFNQFMPWTVY